MFHELFHPLCLCMNNIEKKNTLEIPLGESANSTQSSDTITYELKNYLKVSFNEHLSIERKEKLKKSLKINVDKNKEKVKILIERNHKRKDDIHYIDENEKFKKFYSKIENLIQECIEKSSVSESDDGIYEKN